MTNIKDGDVMGGDLIAVDMKQFNLPDPAHFKERLEGVFQKMYADIDADLAVRTVDLKTDKGRKQIASDAAKISRIKVAMAGKATELVADQKAIIATVTKTRQEMEAEFDKRRDLARAPLTEWETTGKLIEERAKAERGFMLTIRAQSVDGVLVADMSADQLAGLLDARRAMEFDADTYGESSGDLWAMNITTIDWLETSIATARQSELDAAELEELRAMRAKVEADKIEAERAEAQRVEDEMQRQQAEAQRIADEKAEADRAKAERVAETARQEREQAAIVKAAHDAEERAAQAAKDAEARHAREMQDAKDAAAAEAKRIADAEAKRVADEAAEQKRRDEDQEHRRGINREVMAALVGLGLSEDHGKAVVIAISKGNVPHTAIKY